jgi:microcystin-dependent protein
MRKQTLPHPDPKTQEEIKRIDLNAEEISRVTGMIEWFAGQKSDLPDNYFPCDGRGISRKDYQRLFQLIGGAWGTGDGSTTFNLPNLIAGEIPSAAAGGEVTGMYVATNLTTGAALDRVALVPCMRVR